MTAKGIKDVLREVRAKEAAKIAAKDERIALVEAQLKVLRSDRAELVAEAWKHANVVTLAAIKAFAVDGRKYS